MIKAFYITFLLLKSSWRNQNLVFQVCKSLNVALCHHMQLFTHVQWCITSTHIVSVVSIVSMEAEPPFYNVLVVDLNVSMTRNVGSECWKIETVSKYC